jgi:hypothetical protein
VWIGSPNSEMVVWDSGQLIAMGVLITIMMKVLTEAFEKDMKITRPWMPSREKGYISIKFSTI